MGCVNSSAMQANHQERQGSGVEKPPVSGADSLPGKTPVTQPILAGEPRALGVESLKSIEAAPANASEPFGLSSPVDQKPKSEQSGNDLAGQTSIVPTKEEARCTASDFTSLPYTLNHPDAPAMSVLTATTSSDIDDGGASMKQPKEVAESDIFDETIGDTDTCQCDANGFCAIAAAIDENPAAAVFPPPQPPSSAKVLSSADEVFKALDSNGDGILSLSELVSKLSQVGLGQDDAEKLLAVLDTDGNSEVDRKEFVAGFAKFEALVRSSVSGRELMKVWVGSSTRQTGSKVSSVACCHAAGQCCPAPAHKVGLLQDEPSRVVFVGCTGSGKSSLCTALTGQDRTPEQRMNSTFKIGKGAKSETMTCTADDHYWLGEESEGLFKCIDTPGLNDSEGGDEHHINDIIVTMKGVEYVNAIVLVLNGTDPRFSRSLQEAMRRFEQAFCGDTPTQAHTNFYDNLIICFQRWKMNDDAVAEREESNITEQGTMKDFCKQLREKFPHVANRAHDLRCIFVDSHDRNAERKAQRLLMLKQAIPQDVFRTGDLAQIVPRLSGYDASQQIITQSVEIIPMKPQLVDWSVKVVAWYIDPPLPPGLLLCPVTGIISGTPQTHSAPVTFAVVAESLGGKSKSCEIPQVEIRLSDENVQSVVLKYKQEFETLLLPLEKETITDSDQLDRVISKLGEDADGLVLRAKTELNGVFNNMSQLNELVDKVIFAGKEMKTNHEMKLRKKHEKYAKAESEARLKLEKADHEVQRLLLTFTEDYPNLARHIRELKSLEEAAGTSPSSTLERAMHWLQEIEPIECKFKSQGCPHVGLHKNSEEHAESCLFNLPLITHAAVKKIESEDCSAGFKLTATDPVYEDYAGDFQPGPSNYLDDDEEEWFHRVDNKNRRIIRIKYESEHWVLSVREHPDNDTVIFTGSDSPNVVEANFQGFTMTPLTGLAWDENQAAGTLAADSIKLMYFGGKWCPYCPPFTEKLKILYDVIQEFVGPKQLEVIFVSSDRSEGDMLEYYGRHHGDWFALPYKERSLGRRLNESFDVEGIPSLHVIGNDGKEIDYFKGDSEGDIGSAIRRLPASIKAAKNTAIELFQKLKQHYVVDQKGFLGADYDKVIQSVRKARAGESVHANLMGELNDLKNGKFSHAARGLRAYLKVDDEWKEDTQCTVNGMEDEVRRLMDCPDCATVQASVLAEIMNRNEEAEACRSLAGALDSLRAQSKRVKAFHTSTSGADVGVDKLQVEDALRMLEQERQLVESIRKKIKDGGGWYYGCEGSAVEWPQDTVQHAYGCFRQPLCDRCRRYRLDYTSISEDLHYVLHQPSSIKECFNGLRDDGRPVMTLQDFEQTDEAKEAKLTAAEVASLRFYTSHSFGSINEALRNPDSEPHPLPAIATNIQNGIKKLRSLGADDKSARETFILWRGFRDTQSTTEFMDAGGTELAPMSTTADVAVAVGYAVRNSQTCRSLLFRIVTENSLQRGADLRWLSMFPGEAETLFPPLTYLQSTGRHQVVKEGVYELTVVEVKATVP